jgi:hypothetical protein
MKTLKVTLVATVVGTVVGTWAWWSGIGHKMWPGHPNLACFLLTLGSTIAATILWPYFADPHSR